MTASPFGDAFGHHVWATTRLIDACLGLTPEQLATPVPGTYGSILDTQRHLVGSDAWYLFTISGERSAILDDEQVGLEALRAAIQGTDAGWSRLLSQDLDPDAVIEEVDDDDGYERRAPMGIRLAQALHHGSDHRSQICTALTTLGVTPPQIDVWDFGVEAGRIVEVLPTS